MSSESQTGGWYVRSKSGVLGPLTPEQISALLKQGVVQMNDPASCAPDEWRTVREIPGVEQASEKFFHPPPRPAELQNRDETAKHPLITSEELEQTNPTLSLFDTLQAAKDRRPRGTEPALHAAEVRRPFAAKIPMRRWITAAAIAIAIGVAVWAIAKFLTKSPDSPDPAPNSARNSGNVSEPGNEASDTKDVQARHGRPEKGGNTSAPERRNHSTAIPANAGFQRDRLTPGAGSRPAPPPPPPPPPARPQAETHEDFSPASETRGNFDDPVELAEPFPEPANNEASDQGEAVPPRENADDLASPPHVAMPPDPEQPEPAGVVPEGSTFPAPAFD